MGTEIWRTAIVNGEIYEGYEVSNFGQILSLNYHRSGKSKLLKPSKDKDGYFQVTLYKDGKIKRIMVHRLVTEAFLLNPNNLPQVNHKDEDKTNNFVGTPENDYKDGNLEWCTNEYNVNYGTRTEKTSKPVLQLSLTGEIIREWPSTKECGRNGFNQSYVSSCCLGKYKQAYGFLWRYK